MQNKTSGIIANDSRLVGVLEGSYHITPLSIAAEGANTYIIKTASQSFRLYKVSHKHESQLNGIRVQDRLQNGEFTYAPAIIKTTGNKLFVKHSHCLYYMEQYIEGQEVLFDTIDDCIGACRILGSFHSCSSAFKYEGYPAKDTIIRLDRRLQDNRSQLLSFKSVLDRRKLLTEFDKSYVSYIKELFKRLELCTGLIHSFTYDELCQNARQNHTICHNNLFKSLFKAEDNNLYIRSFSNISIGLPVYELSELLIRLMRLDIFLWDFKYLKECIQAYNSEKQLSPQEYGILLSLLVMPDKLLNIGKKRYIKKKDWSEKKYSQRLEKALYVFEKQKALISSYADTYGIQLSPEKVLDEL